MSWAITGSVRQVPPADWPDADSTGVPSGTSLQVVGVDVSSGTGWHARDIGSDSMSVSIDADGVTLDSLDIPGGIYNPNAHTGITITNCQIRLEGWTDGSYGAYLGVGSSVADTEMGGGADGTTRVRSSGFNVESSEAAPSTLTRINVHHVTHCIHNYGDYCTVTDSWLHDVSMGDTDLPNMSGDHTEAVFVFYGEHITYQHCRLDSGNTAVFFAQNNGTWGANTGDLTINGCKFEAVDPRNDEWSNSAIIIENKEIDGTVTVTNNVFDGPAPAGAYPQDIWQLGYPISVPEDVSTVSGNTYASGGSADGDANFVPVES